ncbi:hypothetical protein BKA62DRAFT_723540 [Auriculariales sp. MPI-PUGE-AT-0066]|nr:hypothetical protein BKA62DRAFT_723540 [Auriculariales sp. MPI-PUGE-AT-0066]
MDSFSSIPRADLWVFTEDLLQRPEVPLEVKCKTSGGVKKKVRFSSARRCPFPRLQKRVQQMFEVSAGDTIWYINERGEVIPVTSEKDWTEAIWYFDNNRRRPSYSSKETARQSCLSIYLSVVNDRGITAEAQRL